MSKDWEVAIFWFAFVIVSIWILRRFYFSKNTALSDRLRLVAFVVEAATIGLFLFPWLPKTQGGFSGLSLVLHGNAGATALLTLLCISLGLFLTRNSRLLTIGAVSHIVATVLIFAVMNQMLPGTVRLGLRDVAPVIVALFLLVNTVIVLLLWHQLQKIGLIRTHEISEVKRLR